MDDIFLYWVPMLIVYTVTVGWLSQRYIRLRSVKNHAGMWFWTYAVAVTVMLSTGSLIFERRSLWILLLVIGFWYTFPTVRRPAPPDGTRTKTGKAS